MALSPTSPAAYTLPDVYTEAAVAVVAAEVEDYYEHEASAAATDAYDVGYLDGTEAEDAFLPEVRDCFGEQLKVLEVNVPGDFNPDFATALRAIADALPEDAEGIRTISSYFDGIDGTYTLTAVVAVNG